MVKTHHEIARHYLNSRTKQFALEDVDDARVKFDSMSKTVIKPHISYVEDKTVTKNSIRIRTYRNSNLKLPVIVFFHGGGFVLGSIKSHDSVARSLCKYTNCAVVSVEYNLAPEYKYPNQSRQGIQVVEWLIKNSNSENIDKSNIFLAGDSAGGTLSFEIAVASRPTLFSGMILVYPGLDPRLVSNSMQKYAKDHFLTKEMLTKFWGWYGVDRKSYWPPSDTDINKLPPTLIITAEKDVLKDEGRDLADRLKSQNKIVEYKCYSDMLHGFLQFPSIVSKKKQAFKQISEFVSKNLREV